MLVGGPGAHHSRRTAGPEGRLVAPGGDSRGAGLEFWDGNGVVLMHTREVIGDSIALLLERCVPGTALAEAAAEPDQDTVVCGLLAQLWREPPAGHDFPSLQAMCADWADEYEQHQDRQRLDPGLERAGLELFRGLPATAGRQVLLATDLHAQTCWQRSASRGS